MKALLSRIYRNLKEQPIDPTHPFYVRIWEESKHDPVRRLKKHIQWSEVESLQLFSGFSGSGKTTQLKRLQQELEREGYKVIYANAEDYLNLGEAIDITD
jgi:predicted AAA+ superfamily ATPase